MTLKKILRYARKLPGKIGLLLLTGGASLILGFLSFGGMFALWPILPLAFLSFVLSVAYEGEIYLQNIKGSIKKLFSTSYLENTLAKEYLKDALSELCIDDEVPPDAPQFFKDYIAQLKLLNTFGHKRLNPESKQRKKQIERTLKEMERWFAKQLFSTNAAQRSPYVQELQEWLSEHDQEAWQEQLENRKGQYLGAKIFSGLAGLFMGLGSTYLIVEAFSAIPFFATISFTLWPVMIVPMSLIAGTAYGMLTFNSLTDLINNKTLVTWYNKIRRDLANGFTLQSVLMASAAVLLVALAITLTICTAGTWWTVVSGARPLFDWMKKIPTFVMGVINPIITGFSSLFFNLENTSESLKMVDKALNTVSKDNRPFYKRMYDSVVEGYKDLRSKENWLQIFNPFRIVLKLTITPLRFVLFLGHLASIAVTADRMPGVPQKVAAGGAFLSELGEDAHYFNFIEHDHHHEEEHAHHEHADHHEHDHEEEHCHHHSPSSTLGHTLEERLAVGGGHHHNQDIPTQLLKLIATPLYALAALWDAGASKLNSEREQLNFSDAWDTQQGLGKESNVELPAQLERPSQKWEQEHILAKLERHRKKQEQVWSGQELADEKNRGLENLEERIRNLPADVSLSETLRVEKEQPIYNVHRHNIYRLFGEQNETTATQDMLEELYNCVQR